MTDATDGDDEVCEHDGGQGAADDGEEERRHEGDGIADGRMHDFDEKGAAEAPVDGKAQADEAGDVEGLAAVIPPLGVEEGAQHEADEELDDGADDHGAEEGEKPAPLQRLGAEDHGDHAGAVDGADRPGEHAAVDEMAGGEGVEGDLDAPAKKGVDVEEGEQLQ